jgi:sarcosine oxidase subunit gamma
MARGDNCRILWLGPDEFLVQAPYAGIAEIETALSRALAAEHHAVTDVSDQSVTLQLSGQGARDGLAAGCPLDLHPAAFRPGSCAQSHFLKVGIVLCQLGDEPSYEIGVLRSSAGYLWSALSQALAVLS